VSTVLTTPYVYAPGQDITCVVTAPVTNRTFVTVSADRDANSGNVSVAPAAAGSRPFGVAAWNSAAATLVRVSRGGVLKVTAGGNITAGDPIAVGANGTAVTAAGSAVVVGQAIASALVSGVAQVAMYS
jgi:hypothetical protein